MKYPGVRPDMLFPVVPNIYHPTSCPDHPPVSPGRPLPWNDCYMSGFVRLEVRCQTEWSDNEISAPYQTARMDAFEVSGQGEEDGTDIYGALLNQALFVHSRDGSFVSDLPSENEAEGVEVDSEDPVILSEKNIVTITGHCDFGDKVVVQCSTDLSNLDAVNHPDELYQLMVQFERLKTGLETNRKLRQIEEAHKIDEEHFARYPVPDILPASGTLPARLLARCGKVLKKIVSASWLKRVDCMKSTNLKSQG
ncbi:hypothetical protein VKT23_011006 [Stygiomarasmius scandens]|uniref:Uncharacterized protein n=1 Tax=Marasmiellus scandens TaxID=2682957 RepID=A0ABR1JDQ2_9AGAR